MDFSTIILAVEDNVASITLNRPDRRNAIDDRMREELAHAIAAVRDDESVKALVLSGAGGTFCAGGDLKASSGVRRSAAAMRRRIQNLHRWFEPLVSMEKPVIAAVDGAAFGAGFNLCLAADFILATPRATFCQSFAKVGLIPDLGGLFLLPRMVGLQRAKELILTARVLGAAEAKEIGIVTRIVASDQLAEEALALAKQFRSASMTAIGLAKSVLNRSFSLDQGSLAELEALAQALAAETDEYRAAMSSILEGRKPDFAGVDLSSPGDASSRDARA